MEVEDFIAKYGVIHPLVRWFLALSHPDPDEIATIRDKQLAKMARYHRQDLERMDDWDLERFIRRFLAGNDLLKEENEMTNAVER